MSGGEPDDVAQGRRLAVRARAVVDLAEALEADLERRGGLTLLRDVELPLAGVLARMETTGIAVDTDHLQEMEASLAGQVAQAVADAHASVGREFNLGSPKQLQAVLFDELGLPKTKKIKTGWTTDADSLAWLQGHSDHPVLGHLLRHRDVVRLKTVVDGLLASVADDGRIHTTFQQTVAATGRLSSTDPNLQNIPIRMETGRQIRRAFVVGEGYESLLTADYSQIEMRIMAHLSGDANLQEAFRSGEDLHTYVASQAYGIPAAEVDAEQRRRIKAMSYGLAYGLSAFGLANQLGVSPQEARAQMDTYFERFGGVRDYLRDVVAQARSDGYTETVLGRRRYLPDLVSDNGQRRQMAERMALNAPIQGGAADVVKVAMLRVDEALAREGCAPACCCRSTTSSCARWPPASARLWRPWSGTPWPVRWRWTWRWRSAWAWAAPGTTPPTDAGRPPRPLSPPPAPPSPPAPPHPLSPRAPGVITRRGRVLREPARAPSRPVIDPSGSDRVGVGVGGGRGRRAPGGRAAAAWQAGGRDRRAAPSRSRPPVRREQRLRPRQRRRRSGGSAPARGWRARAGGRPRPRRGRRPLDGRAGVAGPRWAGRRWRPLPCAPPAPPPAAGPAPPRPPAPGCSRPRSPGSAQPPTSWRCSPAARWASRETTPAAASRPASARWSSTPNWGRCTGASRCRGTGARPTSWCRSRSAWPSCSHPGTTPSRSCCRASRRRSSPGTPWSCPRASARLSRVSGWRSCCAPTCPTGCSRWCTATAGSAPRWSATRTWTWCSTPARPRPAARSRAPPAARVRRRSWSAAAKTPLVVDADVDPVWAAQQAALGCFANAGQICTAVERVYVHEAVADAFVEALVAQAGERALGQGTDPATTLGPLVDRRLRDAVHAQVEAAVAAGATLRAGGEVPDGPGSAYPATVLVGCTDDMAVMTEETFGPVAPVQVVASFDEGLAAASRSGYGLAAVVLTRSAEHAQRAWRELPVGTVKVNAVFGGAPGGAASPHRSGGAWGSGRGLGYGPELLDEVTQVKVVHLEPAP